VALAGAEGSQHSTLIRLGYFPVVD
jgi:hypothetical protein